jgi:hypothetical protein
MLYKPLESDPEQYDIGCDSRELRRLYQKAKDIQVWGRIVEQYAKSCNRPHGFWDDEMAAAGRITASLASPFCDFFLTVMNAHGDIAVDRTRDRKEEEIPENYTDGFKGFKIVSAKGAKENA